MTSTTGVKPERHTGELDLFRLYLDEAGRHPLLAQQDEIELSQAYEAGLDAQLALAELPITDPRRPALQAQADPGRAGLAHDDRVQSAPGGLIARRFSATGLPLGALVQEGNLGLLWAVEKFDWRMGCKFSTYATWWIRQAIARGAADRGRGRSGCRCMSTSRSVGCGAPRPACMSCSARSRRTRRWPRIWTCRWGESSG